MIKINFSKIKNKDLPIKARYNTQTEVGFERFEKSYADWIIWSKCGDDFLVSKRSKEVSVIKRHFIEKYNLEFISSEDPDMDWTQSEFLEYHDTAF